jgi:arginine exporter protein ArgO
MIRTITRALFWIAMLSFVWYALSAIEESPAAAMPLVIGAAVILIAIAIALGRRRPTSH